MGLFRKKPSRQAVIEPLPDWDDTRWRSHLRANALGTEHHCGIYVQMINDDRKEAARLYRNDDPPRARNYAESAIRNNRIVTALAALNPLSNALYERSEPLAGYTSLVQIPEPARSGIVTLVFAAARLHMKYLSDTVDFLAEQFGSVHVEQIQNAEGDLYPLVNATVRDALSPAPATRPEVDKELASAVKQYFGIDIAPAHAPPAAHLHSRARTTPIAETAEAMASVSGRARTSALGTAPAAAVAAAAGLGTAAAVGMRPAAATADSTIRGTPPRSSRPVAESQPVTDMRHAQTTPVSTASSDFGTPMSPQLSTERGRIPKVTAPTAVPTAISQETQAPRSRMYASPTTPVAYTQKTADTYPLAASDHMSSAYPLAPHSGSGESGEVQRSRATVLGDSGANDFENEVIDAYGAAQKGLLTSKNAPILKRVPSNENSGPGLGTRSINELRSIPAHVRRFEDGDEALVSRYERLRENLVV